VGVLGGYTTFSAHLLDAHDLLGEPVALTAYVGGTLVTCVLAALVGLAVGRRLHRVTM
jgi:CrcB protein